MPAPNRCPCQGDALKASSSRVNGHAGTSVSAAGDPLPTRPKREPLDGDNRQRERDPDQTPDQQRNRLRGGAVLGRIVEREGHARRKAKSAGARATRHRS